MCLFVRNYQHRNGLPIVLKQPRKVFKVVGKSNDLSPVLRFKYEPHHQYAVDGMRIRTEYETMAMVDEGFHAFLKKADCLSYLQSLYGYDRCANPGLLPEEWKVVEMTIPKGASVYYGKGDEIVSTTIVTGDLKEIQK